VIFVQIETAFQPGPITRMDGLGAGRSFKTICTLARLVHNPCMSSDEEGEASARTDSEEDAAQPAPLESDVELNPVSKPKKAAPIQRDFTEINRWARDDHTEAEIYGYIRTQLASINKDAGLPASIAGLHEDRNKRWGLFTHKRKWPTNKNTVMNFTACCPYAGSHGCPCQVKIVESPSMVILSICNQHTAADHHESKDTSHRLKKHQKAFIAQAVKIAPLQVMHDSFHFNQQYLCNNKSAVRRLVASSS